MACDTQFTSPAQTLTERKEEIKSAIEQLADKLAKGTVKAVVGKNGGIAFSGWLDADRKRITDGCAYRTLMRSGSTAAKMAIMRAEQLAGRPVNKQLVAQGHHSHDGGETWHSGH